MSVRRMGFLVPSAELAGNFTDQLLQGSGRTERPDLRASDPDIVLHDNGKDRPQ